MVPGGATSFCCEADGCGDPGFAAAVAGGAIVGGALMQM